MARKPNPFPTPSLRTRNTAYQIRWFFQKKRYEVAIGGVTPDEAKKLLAATAAALAERNDWPAEIINEPAVKRYIAEKNALNPSTDGKELILKYVAHMRSNHNSTWPTDVRAYLLKTQDFIENNLLNASTEQIHQYLDYIAETHKVTRNRTAAALSGFFRWLRFTGYHPKTHNPMAGIKRVREEKRPLGIITWEKNEIPKLLDAADKLKHGIAVWIAIYAGLRRGEIARLQWTDIHQICIDIRKTKTGAPRQVPIPKVLAEKLAMQPRNGPRVVGWPEALHGWGTAARRMVEKQLPDLLPEIDEKHPEKFGWNVFRHTFASRHAQAGKPLDLIAAWLGDSPKICKEHYARYVPANKRDTRIDLKDDFFK